MNGNGTGQASKAPGEIGAFHLLVLACIFLFAVSAHIRNRVWTSRGNLWVDIADKTFQNRILDPETGQEAPRLARARIYNNIGLYLYDLGREIMRLRLASLAHLQRMPPGESGLPDAPELSLLVQRLNSANETMWAHVPEEFREESRRGGISSEPESQDWDPFLPAELCLRKALYHFPRYTYAHLNLGLVHRLRALRHCRDPEVFRRHLVQAEEEFRVTHALLPAYAKALRYNAEALSDLGQFAESAEWAELAVSRHDPVEGPDVRLATPALAITAHAKAGQWPRGRDLFRSAYLPSETNPERLAVNALTWADLLAGQGLREEATALLRDALPKAGSRAGEIKRWLENQK
jgi:hypothetical protein